MADQADETPEFWRSHPHDDLVRRTADLHRQRREHLVASGAKEVMAVRRAVADLFIQGEGGEVGAGARPCGRHKPRLAHAVHVDALFAASQV
jgi:hypothetical protein